MNYEEIDYIDPEWGVEPKHRHMDDLPDSGQRREYPTGAVRDVTTGKGDMYSMPPDALLRVSRHYERGARKYGRNNYLKGIYVSDFLDSLLRHAYKYLAGWDDEDHLSAIVFNALGAIQMEETKPEMVDVETRKGKRSFGYGGNENGNE